MIDQIDRDILRSLAEDGRLTNRELGSSVGLSPNAAAARVQRLQKQGVISGFHARVNHTALGRPMEASIDVWMADGQDPEPFVGLVKDDERITECFFLTGPLDYRIRVQVSSSDDLADLLRRLKDEAGVRQTDTRLVLEQLAV